MGNLAFFLSKLKWIGLIGILGNITGNPYLKLFWLFFLLGFIEIFSNMAVFGQSLLQLLSYPIMYFKYGNNLPSKETYACREEYILPFEGQWLVVNGGLDRKRSHSWSIWPQRYAYDFVIQDEGEKTYANDNKRLEDYYCYGKNIIAPAGGEVIEAVDKHPNSSVYGNGRVDCKAKDIRGNFLIIKHKENEYSTIAHIQPGSISVRAGDKVIRGQIIARCGNTGNTTEPHIHFQLNDGKSFFNSAGLPIKFKNTGIHQNGEKHSDDYIHRGQKVENG